MIAQALEANGAIVYIIGRRKEVLEKAATTAVCTIRSPVQLLVTSNGALLCVYGISDMHRNMAISMRSKET